MFYGADLTSPDVTGHATVAVNVVSIELRAQLLFDTHRRNIRNPW